MIIDGVREMNRPLFQALEEIESAGERLIHFTAYMKSGFLLDHPDEAGLDITSGKSREKADYLHLLRGWLFESNSQEGAVLKSWVESRFGLLTRNHNGPLYSDAGSPENYQRFLLDRSRAMYNTNSLEMQLDLLYTFCQFESRRRFGEQQHITLYRGLNSLQQHEHLRQKQGNRLVLLLNNLNSFTGDSDRAETFGDYVIKARVPLAKLLYFPGLLAGTLHGEAEHVVIGGAYEVQLCN